MNAQTPEVIQLRFTLTQEDYLRWCEALMQDPEHLMQMRGVRLQRMKCIAWLIGVSGVLTYFAWRNQEELIDQQPHAIQLMLLLLALGSYFLWVNWEYLRTTTPQAIQARQRADTMSEQAHHLQGDYAVSISPEAVTLSRLHGTYAWDWAGIRRIESSHELIRIHTHTQTVVPIPHHALQGVLSPDEFVRRCTELQARHADTFNKEDIERLLAEHDYACPRCTYQLRGIKELRCPECSRPIVPGEIRQRLHQDALKALS